MQPTSVSIDLQLEPQEYLRAFRQPADRPLLREGNRICSQGEVARLAASVADGIAALGESRDGSPRPVGVVVGSGYQLVSSLLGCWKARVLPVLIDPGSRTETETLKEVLGDVHLLADRECAPSLGSFQVTVVPSGTSDASIPSVDSHSLRMPDLAEPAVVFFTSGSEGHSKLIPKTGRQVYGHVRAASQMLGLPRPCRVLCFVPLFHILGFAYGWLIPLRQGGETFLLQGQSPAAMLEALLRFRPDLVVATAVQYRFLNAALANGDDVPDAVYISSGSPLPPRDRDEFTRKTGKTITELYGSTETAGIAWRRGTMRWTPYPGVEFKVEDDRIAVRSPWAHPESSEIWVEMQDAAEAHGDSFRLLGRLDHVVKVGGKRFSTVEVEEVLRSHAGVDDAALVRYERYGEPALAAFVVPAGSSTWSVNQLRCYLTERLAPFKVPRTIHVLESLPRGKLQKLDYAQLRLLAQGHAEKDREGTL